MQVRLNNFLRLEQIWTQHNSVTSWSQMCIGAKPSYPMESATSKNNINMKQGQRSLTICWMAWIVLQPFPALQSTAYTHAYAIPPPLSSSDGLMQAAIKQEAVSLDGRRRLQKPSIGTYGQGIAAVVHSTLSLPKWVAVIAFVLWHGNLHRLLTPLDYTMITDSIVGFKAKKFDLIHQTVFLMRGVFWARD